MKTSPIEPARIEFGSPPRSDIYGDVYHPSAGARAQANHVFLGGNALPRRWASRRSFAILETGFGLGHNFVATWSAWCNDPARCNTLVFTSIEAHPPSRDDLERAHSGNDADERARDLIAAWPPLVPGTHVLAFEQGRVLLQLVLGDVRAALGALRGMFDAFYLDGFAPRCNPAMWDRHVMRALARRAAPGATAATWCVASAVREELEAAGFAVRRLPGLAGKREMLSAAFAPRFAPRRAAVETPASTPSSALVVGAGLAGAWAAWSLARRGVEVTVVERTVEAARGASSQPAGLFHASVHAEDGVHARLHRAAALQVGRHLQPWLDEGRLPGALCGVLRVDATRDAAQRLHAIAHAQRLPESFAKVLGAGEASALAGLPLSRAAWWLPGGGWVDVRALVEQLLADSGARRVSGREVTRIVVREGCWEALCANGDSLAAARVAVLACGAGAAALAAPHGVADWPIASIRGQTSAWMGARSGPRPRVPLVGDGYVIATPQGLLLCGASAHADDDVAEPREADHDFNRQRLTRLTGSAPDPTEPWQGHVGWRQQTPDRLPVIGQLAALDAPATRRDQARFIPRVPGLFVITALGARGVALASLGGELVASQACGTPWSIEADLADAIDPARWLVRAVRRPAPREDSAPAR